LGAVVLSVAPRLAIAQGPVNAGCQAAAATFQDACQKTVDLFDYLAPQLATAVAGGNANLGQADALGGLGHFTIGIRANAVDGDIPKVNNVTLSTTGPAADTLPVTRIPVPMVTADAGVGLFKGIPMGVTHIFGVDALVSALYVPSYSNSNVAVRPVSPLKIGFGGRLGLLGETAFIPGLSVTYLQRDLPQTTVIAVTNGDSLRVQSLDVKTQAWRIVAGKHLLFLGIAAGYGQDKYDASTSVGAEVGGASSGSTPLAAPSMTMTRTNYFGDLSLDFPIIKFGVEVGQVSGGTIQTYDSFAGKPAGASRLYASAGMRIKI
jgi:hypothetical protein